VDLMFRAFSDRNRLRILYLLRDGEVCVGDLVAALQVPQPRVSRHLAYLRKAGLVLARKEKQWNFYSLAPTRNPFHSKLVECITGCFGDVPEIQADSRRLAAARELGGCCEYHEGAPAIFGCANEDAKGAKGRSCAARAGNPKGRKNKAECSTHFF